MDTKRRMLAAVIIGLLLFSSMAAAVPMEVGYVAELRSPNGLPFSGTMDVTVALYPDAMSGVPNWGPHTFDDLDIEGGRLEFVLGQGGSAPMDSMDLSTTELWLEIQVGDDVLTPRQKIVAVPYTVLASDAERLGGLDAAEYLIPSDLPGLGVLFSTSVAQVAFSGAYGDLTGKPALATVATSGNYNDLSNKPALATVATSGNYNDLSNKPALAAVATSGNYNDLSNKPALATVATSGNYNDLSSKPDLSQYLTTSGSPAATSIATTTLNLPKSGSTVSFGYCGGLPTGWSGSTGGTTDGFCMKNGTPGGDAETLFLMSYDNGDTNESVYIGGGAMCCGPSWQGFRIFGNGNALLSGSLSTNQGALFSDMAENVPVVEKVEPGDVVRIERVDQKNFNNSRFSKTTRAYDKTAFGVVSDTFGLAMGPAQNRSPVALAGIVKVKVDPRQGKIEPGDLLTSSPTPGHAMKATQDIPGTVFGKAMEGAEGNPQVILMLVMHR